MLTKQSGSILIYLLHKKDDNSKCKNYRKKTLLDIASKIIALTIKQWIEKKDENTLDQ